ncbi:MAG: alkA [Thermoleophilia bacterium]|nr:alkA [Thermoleophilia bacterium]MCZ4495580.1 alkA [Thermoleophilia bacterium]
MTRKAPAADADVSSLPPAKVRADGLTYGRAAAIKHLRGVDERMDRLIQLAGPFTVRPEGVLDPFAYLIRSIIFQQLNGKAAGTIHGRVLDLFGGEVPSPEALLGTSVETLRTAGCSGGKAASLHDLARHMLDGEIPSHDELRTLSDLELVTRLTAVRGIGPWTVHMVLMFQLGRPDVLPTGDFGIREGWRLVYGHELQPTPAAFRVATEAWRPYRSVASWYMYRAVDLYRAGQLDVVGA